MSGEEKRVPRCQAEVYRRDQYRIVRGHGFKMYYARGQCERAATVGKLCKQHSKLRHCREANFFAFMS